VLDIRAIIILQVQKHNFKKKVDHNFLDRMQQYSYVTCENEEKGSYGSRVQYIQYLKNDPLLKCWILGRFSFYTVRNTISKKVYPKFLDMMQQFPHLTHEKEEKWF